jgi:hypothetical protein
VVVTAVMNRCHVDWQAIVAAMQRVEGMTRCEAESSFNTASELTDDEIDEQMSRVFRHRHL